jgi:hypothetical protein
MLCLWMNALKGKQMIYFVREGLTGPIKIGFSDSTRQRVNSLRSASPNVLTCLAVMRGTRIDEYKLHQQFSDTRVQGEWFTATPALLKYISVNARRCGTLLPYKTERR